ncbi:ArsR/SmtB family transcription factor [Cytophaga hutchinsonii]|jgi:ArsR family transcriptional regulator|nr:metalloregulator ArsR/SmtB family transcription factor [Cytophaga hutchinsonii]SFX10920.1 transcriptional regulator, ArsR family [Cytophaga hutchinsonii ATCC 33406]
MIRLKTVDIQKGSEILKAFSDESRIRILNLILINDEMCISDLELILDYTQTKTSRHLSILKSIGLLKYRKVDQWVYYYINETYIDILKQLFRLFGKEPQLYKDLIEYRTLYANNELAIRKQHIRKKIYKVPDL